MLEIKNASFGYVKHNPLFQQMNLTVHPGEVVGLYGGSGAGKTTFAKVIAGYLKADAGEVLLNGEPIEQHRKRHPVQLIWQHPEKSVNPKWRLKKMFQEAEGMDHTLLAQLDIQDEWFDRRPHELSGGELQRLCVARTLSVTPEYVIADEMTTMLDALTQAKIWHTVLNDVKTRKIGLLAISHDQALLHRISDRLIHFETLA